MAEWVNDSSSLEITVKTERKIVLPSSGSSAGAKTLIDNLTNCPKECLSQYSYAYGNIGSMSHYPDNRDGDSSYLVATDILVTRLVAHPTYVFEHNPPLFLGHGGWPRTRDRAWTRSLRLVAVGNEPFPTCSHGCRSALARSPSPLCAWSASTVVLLQCAKTTQNNYNGGHIMYQLLRCCL